MNKPLAAKRRLLLADDSVTVQKVINLTFADEDIEIITVADGDAAMRKFVEITPDLVLADVNMPGLDGYRICEMIKQDEETKNIPVILLVGSFEPFDEAEARRVGADDFLTKPFQSIRLLVNKVSDLFDRKPGDTDSLLSSESVTAADDFDSDDYFEDFSESAADDEFDSAEASIENLGGAGMDDEMIQTVQPDGEAEEIDEYESKPIVDIAPSPRTTELPPLKESTAYRKPLKNLDDEDDWAKPQPLSKEDLKDITTKADASKAAPLLEAEDVELFEFPILAAGDSKSVEPHSESEISVQVNKKLENAAPIEPEISKSANGGTISNALSPDLIEAIVERAVQKISSGVIKEVVREVIAQMEKEK